MGRSIHRLDDLPKHTAPTPRLPEELGGDEYSGETGKSKASQLRCSLCVWSISAPTRAEPGRPHPNGQVASDIDQHVRTAEGPSRGSQRFGRTPSPTPRWPARARTAGPAPTVQPPGLPGGAGVPSRERARVISRATGSGTPPTLCASSDFSASPPSTGGGADTNGDGSGITSDLVPLLGRFGAPSP